MSKIAGLILFIFFATSASAQITSDRESLRGLNGIGVLLRGDNEHLKQYGLSFDQLDTDVKLRLRKVGIPVIEPRNGESSGANAYIIVSVTLLDIDPNLCGFFVSVSLIQQGYLARTLPRDQERRAIYVTTWERGRIIGSASSSDLRKTVRDAVGDATDTFINDYLAENPKK